MSAIRGIIKRIMIWVATNPALPDSYPPQIALQIVSKNVEPSIVEMVIAATYENRIYIWFRNFAFMTKPLSFRNQAGNCVTGVWVPSLNGSRYRSRTLQWANRLIRGIVPSWLPLWKHQRGGFERWWNASRLIVFRWLVIFWHTLCFFAYYIPLRGK